MLDVQKEPSLIKRSINKVGVRNVPVMLPIIQGLHKEVIFLQSDASIYVSLNDNVKGTHMSRLVETVLKGTEKSNVSGLFVVRDCLQALRERLESKDSYVKYRFSFYMKRKSPKSNHLGYVKIDCELEGESFEDVSNNYYFRAKIPYMSLCPCSKSISVTGAAHNQRSIADIKLQYYSSWLDKLETAPSINTMLYSLVTMVSRSGSSDIYPVVKREDEKHIVDLAYSNPMFVEDVVRKLSEEMDNYKKAVEFVENYVIVVNHLESIHQHDATAIFRSGLV